MQSAFESALVSFALILVASYFMDNSADAVPEDYENHGPTFFDHYFPKVHHSFKTVVTFIHKVIVQDIFRGFLRPLIRRITRDV